MDDRRQRRDVDDVAAARLEVRQARVHRAEHALEVHVDDPLPVLGGRRAHERARGDAGVGDDDVDAAQALDGRADRVVERLAVGHVDLEPHGVRPALGGDLLQRIGLKAEEGDLGALPGELTGGLGADAPRRAGDQDALAAHDAQPSLRRA